MPEDMICAVFDLRRNLSETARSFNDKGFIVYHKQFIHQFYTKKNSSYVWFFTEIISV